MVKKKNRLIYKNGRWYENGKYLPQKKYIYHSSCHEQTYIVSRVTGQKYRLDAALYV